MKAYEIGTIVGSILWMNTLRYGEVKWITQSHTASKWWILDPDNLASEFMPLAPKV